MISDYQIQIEGRTEVHFSRSTILRALQIVIFSKVLNSFFQFTIRYICLQEILIYGI